MFVREDQSLLLTPALKFVETAKDLTPLLLTEMMGTQSQVMAELTDELSNQDGLELEEPQQHQTPAPRFVETAKDSTL